MKTILVFVIAVCFLDNTRAAYSGKYRPDIYSNEELYRSNYYDDRYNNYFGRHQKNFGRNEYYPNYNDFYQPSYYSTLRPHQYLATPFTSFGKSSGFDDIFSSTQRPSVKNTAYVTSTTTAAPLKKVVPQVVVPIVPLAKQAFSSVSYPRHSGYEGSAKIVAQENDVGTNSYHYSYKTENGISAGVNGAVSSKNGGTVVSGFYEYFGDDGQLYRVDYTADENGFHPTGKHLP